MTFTEIRAVLALSGAALLWSGNFIAGRALRDEIDPLTLNLLRWSLCLLVLLPFVGAKAWRHRHVVLREWRLLLALGATGIAAFHSMAYQALASTSAISALLMLALTPAAILAGSALIGASRPSRRQWAGTSLSLIGAAVLLTRAGATAFAGLVPARGELWMIAAVAVWAAYSLLLRRKPVDLPSDVMFAASIAPAIVLLVAAWPFAAAPLHAAPTPQLLGALLYISLGASLVGFLLWSHGVATLGPERAGQFVNLMPVFGAILAVALLGDTITASQVAGALFVFAGMAVSELPGRTRVFNAPAHRGPKGR